jgi:sugar/nucleoside kinase (ribokinase family)
MTESYDAVVAGHICLDIIPDLHSSTMRPEDMFQPGRLVQTGPVSFSSGGPVSNTGLGLRRLGVGTRLMGKVGDDLLGRALREIISGSAGHPDNGLITDANVDTSYTVILSPPGVDRIFFHCPGANDSFGPKDIPFPELSVARLFHFGYPPVMKRMYEHEGRELEEIFRRARQTGVTTSLDMTLPDPDTPAGRIDWVKILSTVLPSVDVFMPSIEEILFMIDRAAYDDLVREDGIPGLLAGLTPALLAETADRLLDMGAAIVGLKLGHQGLYLKSAGRDRLEAAGRARPENIDIWADREMWTPCFKVEVAGTTGAGDATIAGFLASLLRGLDPEDASVVSVAVGACCVEATDAVSGLLGWEETTGRIKRDWPRRDLALTASGWDWDKDHHLWQSKR